MNRSSIFGFLSIFASGAVLGAVGLWLSGSTQIPAGSAAEPATEPAKTVSTRRVSMSADKLKIAKILTTTLEPSKVRQQLQVPATITLNVDRRATVSPRVPGIVRQVSWVRR